MPLWTQNPPLKLQRKMPTSKSLILMALDMISAEISMTSMVKP